MFDADSGIHKPKTSYQKKKRNKFKFLTLSPFQWGNLILSAATLIFLIMYTNYARLQWRESQRMADEAAKSVGKAQTAIDLSKEQFQQDQRPYIWVTNDGLGSPEFVFGKDVATGKNADTGQVIWNVRYTNYGKAPALNTLSERFISVGLNTPFRPSYNPLPVKHNGTPTPPNKTDLMTVVSSTGISPRKFNELLATDQGIRVKIRITYSDSRGGNYETSICLGKLATGGILYCDGSYIK